MTTHKAYADALRQRDALAAENTRLAGVVTAVERAVLDYGLIATSGRDGKWYCRKCGRSAPALKDLQHAECVVGAVSAAIAGSLPASDKSAIRQPDPNCCCCRDGVCEGHGVRR